MLNHKLEENKYERHKGKGKCSGCKKWKKLNQLTSYASYKEKIYYYCGECLKFRKKRQKKYYIDNKTKILAQVKEWRKNNKTKFSQTKKYWRERYQKNKERISKQNRKKYKNNREELIKESMKWQKNNKDKVREHQRKYYRNHKSQRIQEARQWKIEHPELRREYEKRYCAERRKIDLIFNLNQRMKTAINYSLKGNKAGRRWEVLVGYTVKTLKKHLKKTMPSGYTWQNYLEAKLEIDHIIPKSVFNFTKPEDEGFKRCWALNNLQLLTAEANSLKGNEIG